MTNVLNLTLYKYIKHIKSQNTCFFLWCMPLGQIGTPLTVARNISLGRLVNSLTLYAFRLSTLWWKITKTFTIKISQMEKSFGSLAGDLEEHSSREMKSMIFPWIQAWWAIQVSCALDALIQVWLKHPISSRKMF